MPVFIPRRPRGVAVSSVEGSTTGEVVSYGNSAMNKLKPQDYRRAVPGIARTKLDRRSPDRPSSSHDARTGEAGFGKRSWTTGKFNGQTGNGAWRQ